MKLCFGAQLIMSVPVCRDLFICVNLFTIHILFSCGRYQVLAEASEDASKQLTTEWSLNIGESALDIASVSHSASEVDILVLGEHNLFCIRDHGTLKFMRRFEFHPRCFHSYLTGQLYYMFLRHCLLIFLFFFFVFFVTYN